MQSSSSGRSTSLNRYRFGPAQAGDVIVYGAQRPGYPSHLVSPDQMRDWISFMQDNGIRRVCCLLKATQLAYYQLDLLREYQIAFGTQNVCNAGIDDYHLCDRITLEEQILPFLLHSDRTASPAVVHCSGGSGRTGHVLAAWLTRHRGLSVNEALAVVKKTGREPREAVLAGNSTEQELYALLRGDYVLSAKQV